MERTFAIIKPNAFAAGNAVRSSPASTPKVYCRRPEEKLYLSKREAAEGFYYVHKERPFFGELTDHVQRAVHRHGARGRGRDQKWRDLMGATNQPRPPRSALRREFGDNLEQRHPHPDAPETAAFEIGYFFSGLELLV